MHERPRSPTEARARFRFQVIGSLLAAPPGRGELSSAIAELAAREWRHPTSGRSLTLSRSTIERWYYAARDAQDPLGALRSRPRRDSGKTRKISVALEARILAQHREYPSWSYRLHYDNLAALVREEPELGELMSYSTLRRFMKARGLLRQRRRRRARDRDAAETPSRFERREVRSYEVEHVGALWHLDFHHGSIAVVDARGQWRRPIALGVIDDHSRHVAHLQWYFSEGSEELVHGVSQGIQKCGLPRAILTDNGAAMSSAEFREGLERLGVRHDFTVAYSPHQKGCASHCTSFVAWSDGCDEAASAAELSLMFVLHWRAGTRPLEEVVALVITSVRYEQAGASPDLDRSAGDVQALGDLALLEEAAST